MKSYDIAVIGLGALGSAALYQLSKSGLNVIGIDRYNPPHAYGSSFGETRLTRQAIFEGQQYTPMVLRANEIWAELEKTTGQELYNHCGMLLCGYADEHFIRNTTEAAQGYGIAHEILAPNEVETRFPAIKAAQDFSYYYEPGAGFLLPEKCIEVQLKRARDNGATVLTGTGAKSIQEKSDGVHVETQDGESFVAGKVIVATGPWIKELLPGALGHVLKTYLHTLYWFGVDKTHAAALTPDVMPIFLCGVEKSDSTKSFYGFPAVHGAEGGVKFAFGESELETSAEDKDQIERDAGFAQELYGYVSRQIRYLEPTVLRSFNCLYTQTPDFDFIIDHVPGSERIIVGSACSGHGFKHSAATGEILSQLALGMRPTLDIGGFSLGRFSGEQEGVS